MKKTVASLLVFICLAASVFANGTKETKPVSSDTSTPVTLEWWSWDPSLKEKNEALIKQFEAKNPGIKVNLATASTSEYWTKIRILANQKKLPDVFTMSSGYIEEWRKSNLMLNLDSYINNDPDINDFYKSLIDAGKTISGGDRYVAMPFALVTTVLFYNKGMFDAAGLSYPTADWTWDDFLNAAKKLTIDKDGDGKIDQWGFWRYGRYAQVEPWVYADGGNLIDRSKMRFAPDANAMETLKFLTDLTLKYHVAPTQKEMSDVRNQDIFPKGLAAMWVDGSWFIDNNRNVADPSMRWGITTVPVGPHGQKGIVYGWPDYYAIAPNAKHPDAAWKLLKYIAGQGQTADMFMAGKIPSYKPLATSSTFNDPSKQPAEISILTQQAAQTMKTSFTMGWSEWRGYGAAANLGLNSILDSIINGDMSFDEGMSKADKNINSVLARYYN
ncbi:MAG: sugar ABC transporter substrate-binding protein [Spirochaetia bacterium]|jgi:multiple sugar transport system substrate-binding protein|nr:sugar ABC transporter substrate-binding protein [Spirochaetia bacterium]